MITGLVAESAIKAGIRLWRGSEVVCENGELYLRRRDGKTLSLKGQENFKDFFKNTEIGAGELAARKLLCSDKEALAAFNKNLKEEVPKPTPGLNRSRRNER